MCTSVVTGKKATAKEIIIVARNEDFETNIWNKYMKFRAYPAYYNPNGDNPLVKDEIWTLGNGLKVPVPENEFSYSAMPDSEAYMEASHAIGDRFYFEERGINSCNVAISATNSLEINNKANLADPLVSVGIEEAIIPTLILPQATTALDAIKILGEYVGKYGASEVNGILIGDINESWYFEIGSGHHWIAVKVPEDEYIVVANGMRVHSVNLNDKDVVYSKGLFEFVEQNELLEHPNPADFNFAKAFGIIGVPYNVDRIWLAQKILTPSLHQKTGEAQYPLFLKPDQKIRVEDVMEVLRANYDGTVLEGIAERPIGVDRTAESHIITLDSVMPHSLQGIIWQVVSTPLGAPYMPLYQVMDEIPENYEVGNNVFNQTSAYWSFKGLYSLGAVNKGEFSPTVKKLWKTYEDQYLLEQDGLKKSLLEMSLSNNKLAVNYAQNYSVGIARQLSAIGNEEQNNIITTITLDKKDLHEVREDETSLQKFSVSSRV